MTTHYDNLVELFEDNTQKYAERPLFGTKVADRRRWTTYEELRRDVNHLRSGLAELGIGAGDRVAVIADNRVEWAAAAYATYSLGASFVPISEQQQPRAWRFILADCGARAVFAGNEDIRRCVERLRVELPALEHVIGMEQPASYRALLERGKSAPIPARHPRADAIAALIYTSGPTGDPKAVSLSHGNISSNVSAVVGRLDFGPGDRTLSFLPWAQTCELHVVLSMGCELAINDALPKLIDSLAEVRPTILFGVPHVFNELFASIMTELDARPGLIQKLIRAGSSLNAEERLVYSRIRNKLGGRLRYAICAEAGLHFEVAELIDALGIAVYG